MGSILVAQAADQGSHQAATSLLHARLLNARHLASEFQLVQELDLNIPHDCADAQLSHNKGLNRYFNVLPYDYNRVHLQGRSSSTGSAVPRQQQQQPSSSVQSLFSSARPGPSSTSIAGPDNNNHSRYINASLVQHDGGQAVYIATQGPLDSTTPDFWQMVWEQQCPAIVMLTRFEERGNVKCGSYLPLNESESSRSGNFEVRNIGQQQLFAGHLIRRQLQISDLRRNSSQTGTLAPDTLPQQPTLTVQHFQYTAWPDHGTPKDSQAIRFICDAVQQLVRQPTISQAGQPSQDPASASRTSEPAARNTGATPQAPASPSAAVVVHCSAGIGRSGTYIAIDVMRQRLSHLERAGSGFTQAALEQALDLPALVHDMRQQRMGMVQTNEQYQYVYRGLLEELRDLTGETDAGTGANA